MFTHESGMACLHLEVGFAIANQNRSSVGCVKQTISLYVYSSLLVVH